MFLRLLRGFKKSTSVKRIETFLIPQPGEGIAEVEIVQWLVKPNEKVKEFQILCEARSDKGFIEYKSPFDGIITEIMHKSSDMAKIGSELFKINIPDDSSPSIATNKNIQSDPEPETQENQEISINIINKILTTPAIRHLAKANSIDLQKLQGTGPEGRILKEDIMKIIDNAPSPPVVEENKYLENPKHIQPPPMPKAEYKLEDKAIKLSAVQRAMLKSMTESLSIPHLTFCEDVCMDQIIQLRNQLKNNIKDTKITFMPFFVKALSLSILDYPIVNSILNDSENEYLIKGSHNVSFAMDTPYGLIVPNIKDVECKSIYEIAKELNRLVDLGLKGKLADTDLKGGTIAISNIGSIGGTYASPIIMPPQVFIGALGSIRPRLEKFNGEIIEKQILTTGWSADHRLIDGATTARFVQRWKAILENPSLMLLHLK